MVVVDGCGVGDGGGGGGGGVGGGGGGIRERGGGGMTVFRYALSQKDVTWRFPALFTIVLIA